MAHALNDADLPAAPPQVAGEAVKLRDEIHRLSQRLLRARESYDQDLFGGDAEVPLDVQLGVIEAYTARLDGLTEQLRQLNAGMLAPGVPEQARRTDAPPPPEAPAYTVPEPREAPAVAAPPPGAQAGPGIANPDGSPLVCDGSLIRTEQAAVSEYVRYAAEQRWVATTRPSLVAEYAEVCDAILAALAHKHGVTVEAERESQARHVEARYRRDYG